MTEEQPRLLKAQSKMAQWMSQTPPVLCTGQLPVADNPFSGLELPEIEPYEGSVRLGFIYQELCRQLFMAHPAYQIVAEEVQLHSGKETIGAIDFLLQHQNTIEHWEVALKFFLLKDGKWYGPDSRDRLDKKINHMLTHQLKMSETDSFRKQFPDIFQVIPKMLIQGRLYQNPFEPEPIPEKCCHYVLNPECLIGNWCYQHQAHLIGEPLYKLHKSDWLTGNDDKQVALTDFPDYSVHCQSQSGHFWMIVPEHWPE